MYSQAPGVSFGRRVPPMRAEARRSPALCMTCRRHRVNEATVWAGASAHRLLRSPSSSLRPRPDPLMLNDRGTLFLSRGAEWTSERTSAFTAMRALRHTSVWLALRTTCDRLGWRSRDASFAMAKQKPRPRQTGLASFVLSSRLARRSPRRSLGPAQPFPVGRAVQQLELDPVGVIEEDGVVARRVVVL